MRVRVSRFEIVAGVIAALMTLQFLTARSDHMDGYYSAQMAAGARPIWNAGYLIATYGPILLAVCFRRLSRRVPSSWIVHVLFFPAAIMALNVGEKMMLSVIQDPDFDATLGAPVFPALLLFGFAIALYAIALVADALRHREAGRRE